jgi:uncharacterized membrane protein
MIKRYFLAGLLLWLPIWATFVVVRFLFNLLDNVLALLPAAYQPDQLFGRHIPGLGLLLAVLIFILTGLLMTNFIGRRLVAFWEHILDKIPLIRSIYAAVKQVVSAFIQPKSDSFSKVLLIEFPRKGTWGIGFQTSNRFQGTPHTEATVTVFIPTSPNPTSGFLLVVAQSDTIELDITVEEAFKVIVSLGVVMPDINTTPSQAAH